MKTIELDLEKDQKLQSLSGLIKDKDIRIGKEPFNLRLFVSHTLNETIYASFLLLLTKYLSKLIDEANDSNKADATFFGKVAENIYLFYFKSFDIDKLENKIEKDFKIDIEIEKKDPINEVFGIWKNENISLEKIRERAWQRNN